MKLRGIYKHDNPVYGIIYVGKNRYVFYDNRFIYEVVNGKVKKKIRFYYPEGGLTYTGTVVIDDSEKLAYILIGAGEFVVPVYSKTVSNKNSEFKFTQLRLSLRMYVLNYETMEVVQVLDLGGSYLPSYQNIVIKPDNIYVLYTPSRTDYLYFIDLNYLNDPTKWKKYPITYTIGRGNSGAYALVEFNDYIYNYIVQSPESNVYEFILSRHSISNPYNYTIADKIRLSNINSFAIMSLATDGNIIAYVRTQSQTDTTATFRIFWSDDGFIWDYLDVSYPGRTYLTHIAVLGKYILLTAEVRDQSGVYYIDLKLLDYKNKVIVDELQYKAEKNTYLDYPFRLLNNRVYISYRIVDVGNFIGEIEFKNQAQISVNYREINYFFYRKPVLEIYLTDIYGNPLPNKEIEIGLVRQYTVLNPAMKVIKKLTTDSTGRAVFDLTEYSGRRVTFGVRYSGEL